MKKRRIAPLLVLTLAAMLNSACAYLNINKQVSLARNSTILSGMAMCEGDSAGPIVVLAYSRTLGLVKLAHYVVLDGPGSFELMVDSGSYLLFAFLDSNRNLQFDLDERAAGYGHPDPVLVRDSGIIGDLDITIPSGLQSRVDFPVGQIIADRRPAPFHSSLAGSLFSLDDPLYSLKAAEQGYFAPVDFFRSLGGNIYFLEPYDPNRIPVLFVHGAMGSPENFRTMARALNHQRYQAWFFYYPSGAGLDAMSNLLGKKIEDLQRMYEFPQLHIIAHSMGGLVTRNFLNKVGAQQPWIRSFISLSTSWGGVEEAAKGVESSPFVLSSWRDIAKESPFIRSLYARRLPEGLPFYLFFGFRGSRVPWKAYNDGTITLDSQLHPGAQSQANGTFGFNETHTGILENQEVIQQVQALLDRCSIDANPVPAATMHFSFEGLKPDRRPVPFLIHLDQPETKPANPGQPQSGEESLLMDPAKPGGQEATVPPGDYEVSAMAWGYRAEPLATRVKLDAGSSQSVQFHLEPISLLSFRVQARSVENRPIVGLLQPGAEELNITAIRLEGQGIRRELSPRLNDRLTIADHYRLYQDFYIEGRLVFFGLPPGSYQLSIQAQGYRPASISATVLPDRIGPEGLVILEKGGG